MKRLEQEWSGIKSRLIAKNKHSDSRGRNNNLNSPACGDWWICEVRRLENIRERQLFIYWHRNRGLYRISIHFKFFGISILRFGSTILIQSWSILFLMVPFLPSCQPSTTTLGQSSIWFNNKRKSKDCYRYTTDYQTFFFGFDSLMPGLLTGCQNQQDCSVCISSLKRLGFLARFVLA